MTSIPIEDRHALEDAFFALLRGAVERWTADPAAQATLDAVVEQSRARFDAGAREYGDGSFTLATAAQLLDEYSQERVDALCWTMLELVRVARLRPMLSRWASLEAGLVELRAALGTLDSMGNRLARDAATDHVVGAARYLITALDAEPA